MRKTTLLEAYKQDIAGLKVKEAASIRRIWHYASKVYLNALTETSDDPGVPPYDKAYDCYTMPFHPPFLRASIAELRELYRATKPRTVS